MSKPELGILIPIRDKVSPEWAVELARIARAIRVPFKFYLNRHFRLDVARNQLVKQALEDGCRKVLFFDSDLYPFHYNGEKKEWHDYPEAVGLLWNQEYPINSGCYFTKRGTPALYTLVDKDSDKPFAPIDIKLEELWNKVLYIDATGTGFTLIESEVFKCIDPPYFEYKYDFETDKELSEDLAFFLKANEAGFKVLVEGRIILKHEATMLISWDNKAEFFKVW